MKSSKYLKENAKFWFEDLPETKYWTAEDFPEDAEDITQNFVDQFKAKFVTEEKKQNWYTQLSKLKQKKEESTTIFTFFFSSRRRHTRCGRDWSSDVCSSD